jgi:hypothetical protein
MRLSVFHGAAEALQQNTVAALVRLVGQIYLAQSKDTEGTKKGSDFSWFDINLGARNTLGPH